MNTPDLFMMIGENAKEVLKSKFNLKESARAIVKNIIIEK